MKKIVALALSLIMVLGLATTAFAAVPLWGASTTVKYDEFDAKANTYTGTTQTYTYFPAKAPVYNTDGTVKTIGNIAYWTNEAMSELYVMVDKYDADAAFAVKAAKTGIKVGDQTTADALYFMIPVTVVQYGLTGTAFTAFADGCGNISKPATAVATDVFATLDNGPAKGDIYKMAAATINGIDNVLVDGKIYYAFGAKLTANLHAWAVVDYTAKGVIDTCKCVVCGVEGQWVESVYLAPAASKVDQAFLGYVYYGVAGAAGETVESAKTFDAGIAMYVGMSVMAAAGSAVVLKKKD